MRSRRISLSIGLAVTSTWQPTATSLWEISRPAVVAGLTARGWDIHIVGVAPRSARVTATDPATGEQCELDILKEVFNPPPAITPYGPVPALYDAIRTK